MIRDQQRRHRRRGALAPIYADHQPLIGPGAGLPQTTTPPLQALVFFGAGMYRGMWRDASVPDLQRIAAALTASILAIALVLVMLPPQTPPVPRSVMLLDPILLVMLLGGSRLAYRAWKERRVRGVLSGHEKLAVILGAGDAAADLLKNLARAADWRVLGLLDDNPA